MARIPSPDERRILHALAWMCAQYISDNGELDHQCMYAGEEAVEVLVDYGMIEPVRRGGTWTNEGKRLLDETY